jgi:hypothetical protein
MHDLESYEQARQALSRQPVPVLLHANNPHERVFIACFDGTGNDMIDPSKGITNVGLLAKQLEELKFRNPQVGYEYLAGPGTQSNSLARTLDAARGHTYEARIEQMHAQFIKQANIWLKEDPQAQIRVIAVGFSRGAEQAAGFTRVVHERGVPNPDDKNAPPLIPPGQIPQAAGLFDPVATGAPERHDRRLPPSVISAFQISAEDERRNAFPSSAHLDPGMTADGRFLNVMVGGAHSNIGGSYQLDGLSVLSGNLMTRYLNGLSDRPLFEPRTPPTDPARYVVHRSEEHLAMYRTSRYDQLGHRPIVETLGPERLCRLDCRDAEPRDEMLAASFEFRRVPTGAEPAVPAEVMDARRPVIQTATPQPESRFFPRTVTDDYLDAMHATLQRGDTGTASILTQQHMQLPHMQAGQEWGRQLYEAEQQRQREEALRRLEAQQRQEEQKRVQSLEQQQVQVRSRGRSL